MAAGPGDLRALAQPAGQSVIEDARRLIEAFEYDQVVALLDTEIVTMAASPEPDTDALAQAYELRGRAHFNLSRREEAGRDFELLVRLRADYELAADLSPRIDELFAGVKQRLVGLLMLSMPRPAIVAIDGRIYQVEPNPVIELLQGDHEFAIRQPGFSDDIVPFTITPGVSTTLTPRMERISGTLSVTTVPAGARVLVDDVLRGVTVPGTDAGDASAPLLVEDLAPGQHRLRLERDCFVSSDRAFSVATPPDDRDTGPLGLTPAVATVSVRTTAPNAMIYLDGASRGPAINDLTDLCEGPHVIEVRAPSGRFVDRRTWDAGSTVTLDVELRPAFAIVEVDGGRGADALALATRFETAFGNTRGLLIFAPSPDDLETAAQDQRLGTLFSDGEATVMGRRDLVGAWTERLNVQGVAWLTSVPGEADIHDLFLLANDSGQPDVIRLSMGDVGSRAAVERRLGALTPPLVRTTMQTTVVDVAGVEGAAVIRVDDGGAGQAAGLRPGDVIVGAAGAPVASASDAARILAGAEPGALPIEVRAEDGAVRETAVEVVLVPDTIPLDDSGLLYNKILLDLQSRIERPDLDVMPAASQLSLAIAHMRLGSWDLALRALETVGLPAGPGVSSAAVDYLTGLCLREIGQTDEAREAFRRAVAVGEGTLSVGGPLVGPLAQRELDTLP